MRAEAVDTISKAQRAEASRDSRESHVAEAAALRVGLRDPGRRDELVLANLGFVVSVARGYRFAGIPLEELVNEGALGLMEAARRFEPERDVRFITYAAWWIRKSIRSLVERSHVVRIPPYRLRQVREAKESGARRTDSGFLEALATNGVHAISVDDGRGEPPMVERLTQPGQADPEQAFLSAEAVRAVAHSVSLLSEQQRVVIRARFGLDGNPAGTLRSIGSRLGVSRERVRQIETQAVARLRRLLVARGCCRADEAARIGPRPVVTRSSSVRNNGPVHSRPVKLKHANPRIETGPRGGSTIRSGHPISQEETRE